MSEARSLVIVEDDAALARTIKRSFERRDYRVRLAASLDELQVLLAQETPGYAVVDLKLAPGSSGPGGSGPGSSSPGGSRLGGSGLACVEALHARDPAMLIVVLTGYASIATAVEAIKLGACHYLTKPSNTDDIEDAFHKGAGDAQVALTSRATSIKTLEWEHIHQTLVETDFNISEAARRLGMHRRTLARKLEKRRIE